MKDIAAPRENVVMSDKELVLDLLRRLPEDVSIYEIAQKLEFIAAVRQGLAEFDENKDSISVEQVERELTSWSVTVGRKRRGRQRRSPSKIPNTDTPRTARTRAGEAAKTKAGDSLKSPALSPTT